MNYLPQINSYLRDKKLKEAESLVLIAIRDEPDFYIYYLKLGSIYSLMNNFEKAEECFKKAWELNPSALCASHLAELQSQTGKKLIEIKSNKVSSDFISYKKSASANIASLKEKLGFYIPRYKYLQSFMPALALANFGRKALELKDELKADVYLSLLPNSLSAAFNLVDAFGEGRVICDNVENVDRDKHSLPPNYSPPVMRLYNQMCYGAQMQCEKLMTVSDALANDLKRFNKPILTLINSRKFERLGRNSRLYEQLNLSRDKKIVFASGNAVSGFEPILQALSSLPKDYVLVAFVRVKPESYFEKIELLIEELNLSDRVYMRDFVPYEELLEFAQHAHVGVTIADETNPNAAVALPNRFFDYMSAEIPIVMHAMPDVVSYTEKYGLGEIVKDTSAESWREAIYRVVENQSRYKQNVIKAKSEICWEKQEDELYQFLGEPASVTMFGIRDLTQYQRFKRIAMTLLAKNCKVKMFTLSKVSNHSAVIEGVEYYVVDDLNDPSRKPSKLDKRDS